MEDINIYLLDAKQDIYEKIFGKKDELITNKDYGVIEKRKFLGEKKIFFSKTHVKWNGYKYPELNDVNSKKIIKDIFDIIKNSNNKNRIIIKFGNSFIKELSFLINKLEIDKPFILFIFNENDIINDTTFKNFKNPEYISYINDKQDPSDPEKIYLKIVSFLWEKECYFKERGNELCRFLPANLLYHSPRGFLYCNILLTGESRAGKSTFINKIFNKLMSYESGKLESTTREINCYELYPPEEENLTNNLKKGYGGIKIFDTPGLVKTKELNSFEKIKEKLKHVFAQIHFVFFFIKAQSNLEQCIDMLQYINDKNKERIEKNMNKIPIIFIKNGEDLISKDKPVFFQYLKNELKKYNLSDLYDSTINNNNNSNKIEEKDEDDFFKDEEDTTNNYENYIDGNFIQIHIPTGKNINKIFSILNAYLIKYNKLLIDKNQNEFLQMKDNSQKLINYYIKEKIQKKSLSNEEEKELDLLYNKCNKFVKKLKNQCSILYNLDILNRKSKWKKILSGIFMGIFLILPIVNILAI
jgi:GTPase Era involved in 16S rRNA processing